MTPGNNDTGSVLVSTNFPERILQFGQGDMFRKIGFSDEFIREEVMQNSRVVIVIPGNQSSALYKTKDHKISRVLCVKEQWPDILAIAADPGLKIIILKNKLVKKDMLRDNIYLSPPFSSTGKLLALLFARFKKFGGETDKGIAIVSTDCDRENPEVVQSVLLEVAHQNELSPAFMDWIENANRFYSIYA